MNIEAKKIVDKIIDKFQPDKIYLFGSYSTGRISSNSDLDLLVIMKSELPHYKKSSEIKLACSPYEIPIDLLVCSAEEFETHSKQLNHILMEVKNNGTIVYER